MTRKFTIGKTERLKSRKLIDQLFSSGKRFNAGPFRVLYNITAGGDGIKLGVGAGTRNFKRAHDRNRIKRLMREAWRLSSLALKQRVAEQSRSVNVFVLYTGRDLPDYASVTQHMTRIIDNLLRFTNENNTPVP